MRYVFRDVPTHTVQDSPTDHRAAWAASSEVEGLNVGLAQLQAHRGIAPAGKWREALKPAWWSRTRLRLLADRTSVRDRPTQNTSRAPVMPSPRVLHLLRDLAGQCCSPPANVPKLHQPILAIVGSINISGNIQSPEPCVCAVASPSLQAVITALDDEASRGIGNVADAGSWFVVRRGVISGTMLVRRWKREIHKLCSAPVCENIAWVARNCCLWNDQKVGSSQRVAESQGQALTELKAVQQEKPARGTAQQWHGQRLDVSVAFRCFKGRREVETGR